MSVAAGVDRLIVTPYNSSGRVVPLNDPEFSTLTSKPPSGRAKSGLLRAKSMTIKPTTTTSMPPNGIRKTNPNAFHSKPILVGMLIKEYNNMEQAKNRELKTLFFVQFFYLSKYNLRLLNFKYNTKKMFLYLQLENNQKI